MLKNLTFKDFLFSYIGLNIYGGLLVSLLRILGVGDVIGLFISLIGCCYIMFSSLICFSAIKLTPCYENMKKRHLLKLTLISPFVSIKYYQYLQDNLSSKDKIL